MGGHLLERSTAPAWFFLAIATVYVTTAHYGPLLWVDVYGAALPAWNLAQTGSLDLSAFDRVGQVFVDVDGQRLSNRFPGVVLVGVPGYLMSSAFTDRFLTGPQAVTAALLAATSATVMLLLLRRYVPTPWAYAGAGLFALGTSSWSVAADGMWTHAPAALWLVLIMWCVTGSGPPVVAALPAALAVLTRPHLAAALLFMSLLLWRRDRRAAAWTLAGAVVGLAAYLVYARLLFGGWSLNGGYNDSFFDVEKEMQTDWLTGYSTLAWRVENFALLIVSPRFGLLACFPFLVPAVVALAYVRRRVAPELWAFALSGTAYAAVAVTVARISGGTGSWGNRTVSELVVLAIPLLVFAAATHRGGWLWRLSLTLSVAWAVSFQALGAVTPSPAPMNADNRIDVWFWQVPAALATIGTSERVLVLLAGALAALVAWRLTHHGAARHEPASTSASTEPATSTSASSTSR